MIRVIIVDDHPVVRRGLKQIIKASLEKLARALGVTIEQLRG